MTVKVEKISYGGWDDCYLISNGQVETVVTSQIGPRIIRYGFVGKENFMCEKEEHMGKTGGDEWRIYGGHRLWHSPEHEVRSYHPDNSPVQVEAIENGVRVSQETESSTLVKKDMEITLEEQGSRLSVKHTLTNKGLWEIELSAWALTVLGTGGLEVVPQEDEDTGLLPNRMLSLWPYTHLNDPRVYWGSKYIFLKQDPHNAQPFKFGISNTDGWAAYFNYGDMYVKKFKTDKHALYPDYSGSMYETYTTDFMIEMESLSPLVKLKHNQSVEHVEHWELFENVERPVDEQAMCAIREKYID